VGSVHGTYLSQRQGWCNTQAVPVTNSEYSPQLKIDLLSDNFITINSVKFSDTVTKPDTGVVIVKTIDKRNSYKTCNVALWHQSRRWIMELDDTALHACVYIAA
jgi:hypothetical protein